MSLPLIKHIFVGQTVITLLLTSFGFIFSQPVRANSNCPALFRINNVGNPDAPSSVDLVLQNSSGSTLINNVNFRDTSSYLPGTIGDVTANIFQAGTKTLLGSVNFNAVPNTGYTIGYTGLIPYSGTAPTNPDYPNPSPPPNTITVPGTPSPDIIAQANNGTGSILVTSTDLSDPLTGSFKGQWFRWSETAPAIDFAAQASGTGAYDFSKEAFRLKNLAGKGVFRIPTTTSGTYDFNPFLQGSTTPLINNNFNPPVTVGLRNFDVPAGSILDIFAGGNSLLSTRPNTLKLTSTLTTTKIDDNGCIVATSVAGPRSQPIPEPSPILGAISVGIAIAVAKRNKEFNMKTSTQPH